MTIDCDESSERFTARPDAEVENERTALDRLFLHAAAGMFTFTREAAAAVDEVYDESGFLTALIEIGNISAELEEFGVMKLPELHAVLNFAFADALQFVRCFDEVLDAFYDRALLPGKGCIRFTADKESVEYGMLCDLIGIFTLEDFDAAVSDARVPFTPDLDRDDIWR